MRKYGIILVCIIYLCYILTCVCYQVILKLWQPVKRSRTLQRSVVLSSVGPLFPVQDHMEVIGQVSHC